MVGYNVIIGRRKRRRRATQTSRVGKEAFSLLFTTLSFSTFGILQRRVPRLELRAKTYSRGSEAFRLVHDYSPCADPNSGR
ncbi:hypothetical protein WN55_08992 [Dufourea novaeangliae]|uniref:Uncharacterized protein n=1 Tax=Dufourea novaeangliae TaxID=178035 RepID=A0A154P659_DUFNO|nr:hypothetical protein WN55_08992 [Dufourea novaeangliae]